LARIPGVRRAEAFRVTPVRLRNAQRERSVALTGRRSDALLRRLVDLDGLAYSLPPAGLVLDAHLANQLAVAPADTVTVELLEQGGRTERVPVAATIREMVGVSAYMEADM